MERKIIHVDMDAFYAAIEQRDDPSLKGKPIIVGGSPEGRGVVATASYEARTFGIRSAMSAAVAKRLCPQAIFVRPRFEAYQAASRSIRDIFLSYTSVIEPLSLDEAYLDVSSELAETGTAKEIAQSIKEDIFSETGLTASAGVGPNKLIAKLASEFQKPNGLTVVAPSKVDAFMRALLVRQLPGVGKVTGKRLANMGITRVTDLHALSEQALRLEFGDFGTSLYQMARGIDNRPVSSWHVRKSISVEETFGENICSPAEIREQIRHLADSLAARLAKRNLAGRTITLKIKYNDFSQITRAQTVEKRIATAEELHSVALAIFSTQVQLKTSVRLIGLSVRSFDAAEELPKAIQTELPFPVVEHQLSLSEKFATLSRDL